MIKIVTTVGTSLLDKFIYKHDVRLKNNLSNYNNRHCTSKKYDDSIEYSKPKCLEIIENEKRKNASLADICAEMKSIMKIMEKYRDDTFDIQLISTDTALSRLCSELIYESLRGEGKINDIIFDPDKDVIEGLQIWEGKVFQEKGLKELTDYLNKNVEGRFEHSSIPNLVYNITGGYKALIPYMTIMAQLNNIPLFYIFEDTDDLIEIPQMPISINYSLFSKYKHIFKELADEGINDWTSYARKNGLDVEHFQACISYDDSGWAMLSPIGYMFWGKFENSYFTKVPFKYKDEEQNTRNQLDRAIKEISKRIDEYKGDYVKFLNNEKGKDIVHDIFNSTVAVGKFRYDQNPLRIAYEYKESILFIYEYTFEHHEYGKRLRQQYETAKKNADYFTEIVFRK
ncbi:MAG TPA: putative CRISPR-associated protein [Pseudobacteroides sp.]|nr:putative CRISPR-associated protein [Pseudobacteroides sp.]